MDFDLTDEQLTQVDEIIKESGLYISYDLYDYATDEDDNIVGCLFMGVFGENIAFDVIVKPSHQKQGIATKLIESLVNADYPEGYAFTADCVNPVMADLLASTFGFVCERQIMDRKDMVLVP